MAESASVRWDAPPSARPAWRSPVPLAESHTVHAAGERYLGSRGDSIETALSRRGWRTLFPELLRAKMPGVPLRNGEAQIP